VSADDAERADSRQVIRLRTLFFAVLSNEALLPVERIVGVFVAFAIEHERDNGREESGYVAVSVKALACQVGISSGAASKHITRLGQLGAWSKAKGDRELSDAGMSFNPVMLKTTGNLVGTLQALARLSPTKAERKSLTGKDKPGAPSGGRAKIYRDCPECGSPKTDLACRNCGTMTPTDELVDDWTCKLHVVNVLHRERALR